ncbi:MAG: phosphatidylglycerol lysyltransferase domain-containing protein, partial [Myxococcota bacterium]
AALSDAMSRMAVSINSSVVAFLGAVPVYQREGWFFEDVLRHPEAPNGTTELLIDTAMRDIASDNAAFATLGLAPLSGLETNPGPHRLKRRFLVWCYEELGALYGFKGLRRFKERFHPDVWSPQYLVAIPGKVGVLAFAAALRAFANDNLWSFALDTLRRLALRAPSWVWASLVLTLGVLLGVWTLVLALVVPSGWFGFPLLQWIWVAFDASIDVALLALSWRLWHGQGDIRRLCRPLGLVTALNLILTVIHAGWLYHELVGWMLVGTLIALGGPLLTAVVLGILDRAAPELPHHRHA